MSVILLYLTTAAVFLAADAVMLRLVIQPLFRRHLQDWLLEPMRYAPAAAFYPLYVAGLTWLVSWPAYLASRPADALINGVVLGAVAYGTYEFTNFSTLRRWSGRMVAVDFVWGSVITGIAAWIGVLVVL